MARREASSEAEKGEAAMIGGIKPARTGFSQYVGGHGATL